MDTCHVCTPTHVKHKNLTPMQPLPVDIELPSVNSENLQATPQKMLICDMRREHDTE